MTLSDGTDNATVVWATGLRKTNSTNSSTVLISSTARLGSKGPEILLAELAKQVLIPERFSNADVDDDIGEAADG